MVNWQARVIGVIAGVSLSWGFMPVPGAIAAFSFDQQEVDAANFVLVAAPAGEFSHQLLILEQISTTRDCWTESNGVVDPLLLDFDFTGICGRSTDSNGYSLRMAGEDLGLDYSLRVVQQQNDLVLVAISNDNPSLAIAIGSTQGVTSGFAKITLNPGWRITRRMYNGQPLGHFYLTSDLDVATVLGTSPSMAQVNNPAIAVLSDQETSLGITPAPTSSPSAVTPSSTSISLSVTPPATTQSTSNEGWVEFSRSGSTPSSTPQPLIVQPPASSSTTHSPSFTPPSATAPSSPILPVPANNAPLGNTNPSSGLPTVTVSRIPSFNAGSTSNSPPPPPSNLASALGFNYRVIVHASTTTEQNQVRAVVPDAFRTTINGQTVMQAGLFEQQYEADEIYQRLVNAGLDAEILSVN